MALFTHLNICKTLSTKKQPDSIHMHIQCVLSLFWLRFSPIVFFFKLCFLCSVSLAPLLMCVNRFSCLYVWSKNIPNAWHFPSIVKLRFHYHFWCCRYCSCLHFRWNTHAHLYINKKKEETNLWPRQKFGTHRLRIHSHLRHDSWFTIVRVRMFVNYACV